MAAPRNRPLTSQQLLNVLTQWHSAHGQHPAPFPGTSAERTVLPQWLNDIGTRAQAHDITLEHWTNTVLSWIPAAPPGSTRFRDRLLACMEMKRAAGQLAQERFWSWTQSVPTSLENYQSATVERYVWAGVAAVGSAVALPVVGIPLLGATSFTTGGVAPGSIDAGLQSAIYGGATGGVFSVLQSIGARAAFPVAWQLGVGLIGGVAANANDNTNGDVQDVGNT